MGALSMQDAIGKSPASFFKKRFAEKLINNNNSALCDGSVIVADEVGTTINDISLQGLTFKYPWYFENRIIGIFGWTIIIKENSISQLANILSQMLLTGLLAPHQTLSRIISQGAKFGDVYISARENEVLFY